MRPSPVGPRLEKYQTPYECGLKRWVAPTVITPSALPGSVMLMCGYPSLEARVRSSGTRA